GLDKVLLSDRNRGLIIVDASGVAPNGDFDGDGDVDGQDFLTWQRGFGTTNATLADGDANRDRTVGAPDLDVWMQQYGHATHPHDGPHAHSTQVPESSTLLLLLAGLPLLARVEKR